MTLKQHYLNIFSCRHKNRPEEIIVFLYLKEVFDEEPPDGFFAYGNSKEIYKTKNLSMFQYTFIMNSSHANTIWDKYIDNTNEIMIHNRLFKKSKKQIESNSADDKSFYYPSYNDVQYIKDKDNIFPSSFRAAIDEIAGQLIPQKGISRIFPPNLISAFLLNKYFIDQITGVRLYELHEVIFIGTSRDKDHKEIKEYIGLFNEPIGKNDKYKIFVKNSDNEEYSAIIDKDNTIFKIPVPKPFSKGVLEIHTIPSGSVIYSNKFSLVNKITINTKITSRMIKDLDGNSYPIEDSREKNIHLDPPADCAWQMLLFKTIWSPFFKAI